MLRRVVIFVLTLSLACQGGIFANERELCLGSENHPMQISSDLQGSIGDDATSGKTTENGNLVTREACLQTVCTVTGRHIPTPAVIVPLNRLAGIFSEATPTGPFCPPEWGLTNSRLARSDG
ncbi:MAG: hypothetical protein HQM09_06470 [Candidatus Riflebacteria bacterium]|nr:hypothetical protein [Candidatus Riflebacteria bacterium]